MNARSISVALALTIVLGGLAVGFTMNRGSYAPSHCALVTDAIGKAVVFARCGDHVPAVSMACNDPRVYALLNGLGLKPAPEGQCPK